MWTLFLYALNLCSVYGNNEIVHHCPVCNMNMVNETSGVDIDWYVQYAFGQKVHTCGMASGLNFKYGQAFMSHPSRIGLNISMFLVECDDGVGNSRNGTVLDPVSGEVVDESDFDMLCVKKGQRIYFTNTANRDEFKKRVMAIPYVMVAKLVCDGKECPDAYEVPEVQEEDDRDMNEAPRLPTNADSGRSSQDSFCTGGSAMFNGFSSTMDATCVLLLFQPFVLSSGWKYFFGLLGVFFAAILNEALVKWREQVRVWTVKDINNRRKLILVNDGESNVQSTLQWIRYRNKLVLSLLYMLQMTIAYMLMLVVMTYESGLFVTLVLGFGAGYTFFKNVDIYSESTVNYDRQVSQRRLSEALFPSEAIVLDVEGMRCMKNCGTTVKNALLSVDGVTRASILFKERQAIVAGTASPSDLIDAIDSVGFSATLCRTNVLSEQ